ncbi:hypothetical protein B0H14DRAFT_2621273 [Mycena olivaceomarginata]|nr:hypothetical protein B0H14DRAFT_2621273 [Mycena olivaceomarginata]
MSHPHIIWMPPVSQPWDNLPKSDKHMSGRYPQSRFCPQRTQPDLRGEVRTESASRLCRTPMSRPHFATAPSARTRPHVALLSLTSAPVSTSHHLRRLISRIQSHANEQRLHDIPSKKTFCVYMQRTDGFDGRDPGLRPDGRMRGKRGGLGGTESALSNTVKCRPVFLMTAIPILRHWAKRDVSSSPQMTFSPRLRNPNFRVQIELEIIDHRSPDVADSRIPLPRTMAASYPEITDQIFLRPAPKPLFDHAQNLVATTVPQRRPMQPKSSVKDSEDLRKKEVEARKLDAVDAFWGRIDKVFRQTFESMMMSNISSSFPSLSMVARNPEHSKDLILSLEGSQILVTHYSES